MELLFDNRATVIQSLLAAVLVKIPSAIISRDRYINNHLHTIKDDITYEKQQEQDLFLQYNPMTSGY